MPAVPDDHQFTWRSFPVLQRVIAGCRQENAGQSKGDDHDDAYPPGPYRRRLAGRHVICNGADGVFSLLRPHRSAPNPDWTDMSDPYGGHDPNSQAGNRAFWDHIARHGN
jgi:hypothetical protein